MTGAVLGIVSVATTAIGAGISAYGQYQAGKTANAVAQYNARQLEIETRTQFAAMQAQARLQEKQAEANYRMREAEAQARFANARQLEQDARDEDDRSRENIRRQQKDFERMKAEQRTAIAESGIAETVGTPLDLLAETAAQIQTEAEDSAYQNELNRRSLFREADLERLGGQFAQAGATIDRNSALAGAKLKSAAAYSARSQGRAQAEIMRLTGQAKQSAATIGAAGTMFGGAVKAWGGVNALNPKAPKSFSTT